MSGVLRIERVGPLTTIQDDGRFGMLAHGISAAGPMDRHGYAAAGQALGAAGAAIEFTRAGLALTLESGAVRAGFAGGDFVASLNEEPLPWPGEALLAHGDRLEISPGPAGNYGYLRFDQEIDVPLVLGSRSTSTRARLGGIDGRSLRAGDRLELAPLGSVPPSMRQAPATEDGRIRIVWGIHADLFNGLTRTAFLDSTFSVSARMDRMGVWLEDRDGVFAQTRVLSLVSDALVAGDIQILGDGTPVVLMRDHQPTGGYPRIATVISADLDRFAQMRPGTELRFHPVGLADAQRAAR